MSFALRSIKIRQWYFYRKIPITSARIFNRKHITVIFLDIVLITTATRSHSRNNKYFTIYFVFLSYYATLLTVRKDDLVQITYHIRVKIEPLVAGNKVNRSLVHGREMVNLGNHITHSKFQRIYDRLYALIY